MTPLPVSSFEQQIPHLLELLQNLVEMESPTTSKAAVDRLGGFLVERLRHLGADLKKHAREAVGDHWHAQWGSSPGGILLLAHMDTVYPLKTLERMPWSTHDGLARGPGVLDMKGGLAMALVALQTLIQTQKMPSTRVSLLCTSDEETGSRHSRALIEELAQQHEVVLCLEPGLPDGSVKTWRKGTGVFTLEARGRAAHAGADLENGINAIVEVAHQILRLLDLADPEAGTSVNIGTIRGGSRVNIVPETSRVRIDIRVKTPEERERLDRALRTFAPVLSGASIDIQGDWNRPPMMRTPSILQAYSRAKEIAAQLGIDLTEGGTGGASDANFVAQLGVPVLDGLGAIGSGAHAPSEHLILEDLPRRTALLAALISEW